MPGNGKVEICGVNTARLPVLRGEEMRRLLERAQSGDKAAREALIRGNLRLVLSVLQKFTGRGENMDDLFQVGCIGLIKAIDHFDTSQQVRFSTYGVATITGGVKTALRDRKPLEIKHFLRISQKGAIKYYVNYRPI